MKSWVALLMILSLVSLTPVLAQKKQEVEVNEAATPENSFISLVNAWQGYQGYQSPRSLRIGILRMVIRGVDERGTVDGDIFINGDQKQTLRFQAIPKNSRGRIEFEWQTYMWGFAGELVNENEIRGSISLKTSERMRSGSPYSFRREK